MSSSSSQSSTDEFTFPKDEMSSSDEIDRIGKFLTSLGEAKIALANLPVEFLDDIENDAILYWQVEKRLRKKGYRAVWARANPSNDCWPTEKTEFRKAKIRAHDASDPAKKRVRFSAPAPASIEKAEEPILPRHVPLDDTVQGPDRVLPLSTPLNTPEVPHHTCPSCGRLHRWDRLCICDDPR